MQRAFLKNVSGHYDKSLRLPLFNTHTHPPQKKLACAVETHVKMSQGNLHARIYNEKARSQMEDPDLTSAFNASSKNPSVSVGTPLFTCLVDEKNVSPHSQFFIRGGGRGVGRLLIIGGKD